MTEKELEAKLAAYRAAKNQIVNDAERAIEIPPAAKVANWDRIARLVKARVESLVDQGGWNRAEVLDVIGAEVLVTIFGDGEADKFNRLVN